MPKRELNNGPVIQKEKETVSQMIAIYCRKNTTARRFAKNASIYKTIA